MALNKEFLTGLGVSEDAIGQIMAEHGKGIQAEQNKTAIERERANSVMSQLEEANGKLTGYDPDWSTKLKQSQEEANSRIERMQFDYALNGALRDAGARNIKAVTALIEKEKLVHKDGQIIGLDAQIEALKTDSAYLFKQEDSEQQRIITRPTNNGVSNPLGGDKKAEANAAFRAVFGKK